MKHILNIPGWMFSTLSRKRILTAFLYIGLVAVFSGCDSEDATDCLQTDGDAITRTLELPFFNKVRTENDIRLEITQGDTQHIIIETRENLFNDLVFKVEDETFIMQNNT